MKLSLPRKGHPAIVSHHLAAEDSRGSYRAQAGPPAHGGIPVLCLSRKKNEKVLIGDPINGPMVEVMVLEIRGDKVRLGFSAPSSVPIHRKEVAESIRRNGRRRKQAAARG